MSRRRSAMRCYLSPRTNLIPQLNFISKISSDSAVFFMHVSMPVGLVTDATVVAVLPFVAVFSDDKLKKGEAL